MKIVYTTRATADHGGRGTGTTATEDGKVAVKLSTPKAMGGDDGPGTNPEQLFAMGYAACFLGAMKSTARKAGKALPEDATVTASVSFADREDNVGYTIVAALEAKVPGWSKADIEANIKAAHDVCPYSDLIRKTHEVELKAVA